MLRFALIAGILCAAPSLAADEDWMPPEVSLRDRGDGMLLTDPKGMTLYTFDGDVKPGASVCVGPCETEWPPLAAQPGATAQGDWSLIPRADGSRQWAYQGKPVYRHSRDERPGDEIGEAGAKKFINLWHVIFRTMPTPPGVKVQSTAAGWVLADARGMTLYTAKGKADGLVPLEAPALATGASGPWATVTRADGRRQWTHNGKPLFTSPRDKMPAQVGDQAAEARIVRPVPMPPGVTVQMTEHGWVYGDGRGHTLYLFDATDPFIAATCDEACFKANWRPLDVPRVTPDPLMWTWRMGREGREQWFYRGKPVYTFNADTKPGDLWGYLFGDIVGPGGAWTLAEPPI